MFRHNWLARRVVRALLLRCPRCGATGIRTSWLKMKGRCPSCGLALDRGERDYWLGAYAINLVVAEGLTAVVGLVLLRITWPNIVPAMIVASVLAIALPFLFFPFSRTLWLAFDLSFRSSEPGDLPRHDRPSVPRRIVGYHQDDEGHWVADLECGHGQHVRHEPPLVSRPWVLTPEGRASMLGTELGCVRCIVTGH